MSDALAAPPWLPPLVSDPSPNFNSRGGCKVDQVILHDMEGSFAGSVEWFDETASHVSAHYGIRDDGQTIALVVDPLNRAWHACAYNSRSVGIEMAGYSKNGFSAAERLAAARLVAHLCHRFAIPIQHARGGVGPGIESHWGLGAAGGGHSDPSTVAGWMDDFIALVKQESAAGRFPIGYALAGAEAAAKPADHDVKTPLGLQNALASLHFALSCDGQLGPETEGVIQTVQVLSGLKATGAADDATQAAILKALSGG